MILKFNPDKTLTIVDTNVFQYENKADKITAELPLTYGVYNLSNFSVLAKFKSIDNYDVVQLEFSEATEDKLIFETDIDINLTVSAGKYKLWLEIVSADGTVIASENVYIMIQYKEDISENLTEHEISLLNQWQIRMVELEDEIREFEDEIEAAEAERIDLYNKFSNFTAEAETLSPESEATAQVTIGENSVKVDFGIPQGIQGQQSYVHIKYATEEPYFDEQIIDTPSAWIGIYTGLSDTPPTSYRDYAWYHWDNTGYFVTIDQPQEITGHKNFTGKLQKSGEDVVATITIEQTGVLIDQYMDSGVSYPSNLYDKIIHGNVYEIKLGISTYNAPFNFWAEEISYEDGNYLLQITPDTIRIDDKSGLGVGADVKITGIYKCKQIDGSLIPDRHTHSNKDLLDTYTQTEADIESAISNAHSHDNKALLDTYTQTEADIESAVQSTHTHDNKSVIDSYTQTEENIANAIENTHTHENKSVLDNITSTDTDNIKTIPDKADKLKVAELEKDLSDYKKTLSLVNINQEAKQTAEDTVITLPKNAANGQAQAKLLGQTYIFNQLVNNGNFSSGFDGWTLFYAAGISTIENGFTTAYSGSNRDIGVRQELLDISINDKLYIALDGLHISGKNSGVVFWDSNSYTNIEQSGITITGTSWQKYSIIHTATKTNPRLGIYAAWTTDTSFSVKNIRTINLTKMFGAGNEPELGEFESMYPENYYPYSTGEYISVNGAFRLTSTDGTQVSQVYFPSYTLRSAGEVHDELTQDSFIKRVSDTGEVLAQPIVTPIQTSETLLSYPDGTVTSEGAVADAGVYGYNGIYVINHDLPIKTLEKIVKIDYETGIETEIPVGNAIISPDKISFTHPNLSKGDIVFFTYYHDVESIPPIINIEYYDSRYTIKDTTNDKFYQWNIISTNGAPSITLTEV